LQPLVDLYKNHFEDERFSTGILCSEIYSSTGATADSLPVTNGVFHFVVSGLMQSSASQPFSA